MNIQNGWMEVPHGRSKAEEAQYRHLDGKVSPSCDYVGVPITQAWSIATFYKSFSLEPRGEHEIKVCLGTTCHLKGGEHLATACERALHVERGETTEDMRFTLDTVKCVGACSEAPVVMVDKEYLGQASLLSLKQHLKKL